MQQLRKRVQIRPFEKESEAADAGGRKRSWYFFILIGILIFGGVEWFVWKQSASEIPYRNRIVRELVKPTGLEIHQLRLKLEQTVTEIGPMANRTTETIRFEKLPDADTSQGHRSLPAIFYEATFYGLSAMNPSGQTKSEEYNTLAHKELGIALSHMPYRPAFIYNCTLYANGEIEQGYLLEYPHVNREIEQRVQFEAKRFGQIAMFKWFAHTWGGDHSSVIQHVMATTAGYQNIESKGPVYLV